MRIEKKIRELTEIKTNFKIWREILKGTEWIPLYLEHDSHKLVLIQRWISFLGCVYFWGAGVVFKTVFLWHLHYFQLLAEFTFSVFSCCLFSHFFSNCLWLRTVKWKFSSKLEFWKFFVLFLFSSWEKLTTSNNKIWGSCKICKLLFS